MSLDRLWNQLRAELRADFPDLPEFSNQQMPLMDQAGPSLPFRLPRKDKNEASQRFRHPLDLEVEEVCWLVLALLCY